MLFRTILRPLRRNSTAVRGGPWRSCTSQTKFQSEIEGINYGKVIQSQGDVDRVTPDAISGLDVPDTVALLFHTARKSLSLSQDQLDGMALNLSRKSVDIFDAQSVSNVLYGLHPYNSITRNMDKLLMAIVYKVTLSDEDLRAQHIGNALYGLQGMDSKNVAVRKLILALAEVSDSLHCVVIVSFSYTSLLSLAMCRELIRAQRN